MHGVVNDKFCCTHYGLLIANAVHRSLGLFLEIKKEMEAQLSVYLQSLEASIFGRHEAINQELEPILKELDGSLERIGRYNTYIYIYLFCILSEKFLSALDKLEAEREEYRVALSSLLRGLEDPEV